MKTLIVILILIGLVGLVIYLKNKNKKNDIYPLW